MSCCPATDLLFSQVREDPLVEREVVARVAARLGRRVRVLLIASGGCTAVSLLGEPTVAEVHALDANPAQLQLATLRQHAALRLAPARTRVLLGDDGDARERLATYRALRPALPATTAAYWDAREAELAFGVNRVGRFEALFRELVAELAAAGIDAAADGDRATARPGWREAFQRVFERGKLARTFGEDAVAYSMDRSFADHFEAQFATALGRWRVEDNYFLHQVLRDRYPTAPRQVPPYLADGFAERADALGGARLFLHAGSLSSRLGADDLGAAARFDVVQTSNISDWMPLAETDALLARVRGCLTPGGAHIGRRLNGDHILAERVARQLTFDAPLSTELAARDRSFFYREVTVAWA